MKRNAALTTAILLAIGVQGYAFADEVKGDVESSLTGGDYTITGDINYVGDDYNGLFYNSRSQKYNQNITASGINNIASSTTTFYMNNGGYTQTININADGKEPLGTISGKNSIFKVSGVTDKDPKNNAHQIVNLNVKELLLTGNNKLMYQGDVAIDNTGIQQINGYIGKIAIAEQSATTSSQAFTNAAIFTTGTATGNPELDSSAQDIYATIGQIGDEENRFGGGIISQQGAHQYVEHVGKIYAQQYGIATYLSDLAGQTVKYVGDIDVYSRNEKVSAIGIYNSSDTGNYDYYDSYQYVGVGNNIKADGAGNAYGVANLAGKQVISSLNHNGISIYGKTYSVYVNPTGIYNNTHSVNTKTTLQGNFNIVNGDIKVKAPTKFSSQNSSTIQFMHGEVLDNDDFSSDNKMVLGDDVSIVIDEGNNDDKDNTRLILGDTTDADDIGYRIIMGKNSNIDDKGVFQGNGFITYKVDENKNVIGGGILLNKVYKNETGLNTKLDLGVGDGEITSDGFADKASAEKALRDTANRVFVNEGVENIGTDDKVLSNGKKKAGDVALAEGLTHAWHAEWFFDEDTNVIASDNIEGLNNNHYKYQGNILNIEDKETPTMGGIDSAAMLNYFAWRQEIETISQRLGEVRDLPKQDGKWMKVFGSQTKYDKGNNYFQNDYRAVAFGYDRKQKDSKWTIGGMFSYIDGESNLANGGEGTNWIATGALYGTHNSKNGEYIDLIAKLSKMHGDFTVYGDDRRLVSNGNTSNWAWALSAEYGHRYEGKYGYFFDPQMQLTYGRINGDEYTTDSGVLVEQDHIHSLIGRAGLSMGRKLNNGSYFARFDVLREWKGELTSTFSKDGGEPNLGTADMSDTWYELSVGATCNFQPDTTGYFQVKRSFDADLQTKYRVDIGLRYNF